VLAAIASAVLFTSAAHAGDKNDKDSHKKNNGPFEFRQRPRSRSDDWVEDRHKKDDGVLVHEGIDWSTIGHKKDGLVHEGIDWSDLGHKHDGCDKPTVPPIDPGPGNGPIVLPGTGSGQTTNPHPVIRNHRTEGKVGSRSSHERWQQTQPAE